MGVEEPFGSSSTKKSSGAKYFSCLVNTMNKGVREVSTSMTSNISVHSLGERNDVHRREGLSGRSEMAVFAPAGELHRIDVGPDEDLTYVLSMPRRPRAATEEIRSKAFDQR